MSSQASGKGKERERVPPPPDAQVYVLEDSEPDSDTEFFTVKQPIRRVPAKKRAPQKPPTPTRPGREPSEVLSDSGSDSDAERRRKRRKAKARAKAPSLPEWTRQTRTSVDRGRSHTAGRESSEPISLVLDEDRHQGDGGKGKKRFRHRVELTPPPELGEEEKERIKEQSRLLFQEVGIIDDDVVEVASSSPAPNQYGATVQITVQMVADPEKRALPGSEAAVRGYERKRVFHVFQNDPLSKLVQVLADRVQKPAGELVLVHEGQRIFSTEKTPAQLGISFTGEMKGYELSVYEKIQREGRRARLALFPDGDGAVASPTRPFDLDADSPRASGSGPAPAYSPRPSPPRVEKVKLHFRGPKGDVHFSAAPTTLVSTMLKYYCNKLGVDPSDMPKYRLDFDGEHFGGDSTVEDMGVENGDLIDVSCRD